MSKNGHASKDDADLNKIRIPVAAIRELAIELLKEGKNEIGLRDLLYRIQEAYHRYE